MVQQMILIIRLLRVLKHDVRRVIQTNVSAKRPVGRELAGIPNFRKVTVVLPPRRVPLQRIRYCRLEFSRYDQHMMASLKNICKC